MKVLESKLLKWNVECKAKGLDDSSNFPEVSKSRHSPLVLVGAPVQGFSSILFLARTKCSLWDDSLPLRRGESLTTTYNVELGHQQSHLGDTDHQK
jgi:hypothetical protein